MKLAQGIAKLWYRDAWVDAITDEVARETGKFVEWLPDEGRVFTRQRARVYTHKKPFRGRFAVFEDANGRRWAQRDPSGIGASMVVRIEVVDEDHVVIRNEDGSFKMVTVLSGPLRARMRGKKVAFFDAKVVQRIIELEEWKDDPKWKGER